MVFTTGNRRMKRCLYVYWLSRKGKATTTLNDRLPRLRYLSAKHSKRKLKWDSHMDNMAADPTTWIE